MILDKIVNEKRVRLKKEMSEGYNRGWKERISRPGLPLKP